MKLKRIEYRKIREHEFRAVFEFTDTFPTVFCGRLDTETRTGEIFEIYGPGDMIAEHNDAAIMEPSRIFAEYPFLTAFFIDSDSDYFRRAADAFGFLDGPVSGRNDTEKEKGV